jgi:hypothetical protein
MPPPEPVVVIVPPIVVPAITNITNTGLLTISFNDTLFVPQNMTTEYK